MGLFGHPVCRDQDRVPAQRHQIHDCRIARARDPVMRKLARKAGFGRGEIRHQDPVKPPQQIELYRIRNQLKGSQQARQDLPDLMTDEK